MSFLNLVNNGANTFSAQVELSTNPFIPTITPISGSNLSNLSTTSEAPIRPFLLQIDGPSSTDVHSVKIEVTGVGGELSYEFGPLSYSEEGQYYWGKAKYGDFEWLLTHTTFIPKAGAPAAQSETHFKITFFEDENLQTPIATYDQISVINIDPPVAPKITAPEISLTATSDVGVNPFADVTLADTNAGASEKLTITKGGGGTLAGDGLTNNGDGTYTLTGSAAEVARLLHGLTFTLTGAAADVARHLQALTFTPDANHPGAVTTFKLTDKSIVNGQPVSTSNEITVMVSDTDSPPSTGQISGRVFNDNNANKAYDGADRPLIGTVVTLYDSDLNLMGETTTDSTGHYSFTGLADALYTVMLSTISGYLPAVTNFYDDGKIYITNLKVGNGEAITLDEGFYPVAHITGHVLDGAQVPQTGIEIELYDSPTHFVARTISGSDGRYSFDDLLPGAYIEKVVTADGAALIRDKNVTVGVGETTTLDISLKPHIPSNDFNGDGKSDILLRDGANGNCFVWEWQLLHLGNGWPQAAQRNQLRLCRLDAAERRLARHGLSSLSQARPSFIARIPLFGAGSGCSAWDDRAFMHGCFNHPIRRAGSGSWRQTPIRRDARAAAAIPYGATSSNRKTQKIVRCTAPCSTVERPVPRVRMLVTRVSASKIC